MISIQYLLIFYMIQLTVFSFLNFNKKRETKKLNTVIVIALSILDLFRYLQDGQHSVQFYDSGLVLTIAVVVLVHSMQGFKKLSIWLVAITSLLISSFISTVASGFLLTVMRIDVISRSENPIISTIGLLSGVGLFHTFNFIIKKLDLQINVRALSRKEIFIVMLYVSVFGYYANNMYNILDEYIGVLRFSISLFSLLIGVLPVYGIVYIITQKNYIKYIEFREQQQELLFEEERIHYHQMNERNKEIRIFKHDIDDELDYINYLAKNGNLQEISNQIKKMKVETDKIVRPISHDTGLDVVNSSLYRLTTDTKYANIKCEWFGKIPSNLIMDNRDVMKLFANLLKNSFEAAYQSQNKFVYVKIFAQANRLAIVMKNSYSNEIKKNADGTFETTNLEKENHGIGTRIIKDIVNAYAGNIYHTYDDNEFTVKIIFGSSIYKGTSH